MSEYAALKKSNGPKTLSVLLALLILLELCSVAVLTGRVINYSSDKGNYTISLTNGSNVRKGILREDGSILWESGSEVPSYNQYGMLTASIGARLGGSAVRRFVPLTGTAFSVVDDKQVWGTTTDIEIFKISYNETGKVTVMTANGDKLIAPGTANDYSFTVKNDEKVGLDYTLYVDAWIEGTKEIIPVEAVMYNQDGKYLAGTSTTMVPVLELDGIVEKTSLAGGAQRKYFLGWRWPFERFDGDGLDANDEFDTMLGNLAVDGDLVLHIRIRTEAVMDDNVDTGEATTTLMWSLIAGGCLVLIVVLLVLKKREEKRDVAER